MKTTQGATAPTPSTDIINNLQATITFMDSLSQEGFSQIAAIANLAILAIEKKTAAAGGLPFLSDVVHALRVISGKAEDIESCINCEAEKVGCNWDEDSKGANHA